MAIEINIHKAVTMSLVNKVGGSGSKWIEIVIRDGDGQNHEINVFVADEGLGMFFGCKEGD
jgi:hypothetical protein